ncbi:MAG: ATP-binding protein, partial [Acidobacteriota bacterium]
IINDILDFSKIEAGQLAVDPQPFAVAAELLAWVEPLQQLAINKGLDLRLEIAPEVPEEATSDAHRLRQIFNNLVSNAIKFTPEGSVRVRLTSRPLSDEIEEFSIEVIDSGIGMSPEQLQKVFKPFVQADGSTTRQYGGTGLGLSISRQLATLLGGRLEAQSTEGKGSVFQLIFPGEVAVRVTRERTEVDRALDVLLVENSGANQLVAKQFLEGWGFQVTVARNGPEGVDCAAVNRYDLVLVDLHLTRRGGLEMASRIRAWDRDRGRRTPIVALSADPEQGCREDCEQAGLDGWVIKPFSGAQLRQAIDRACRAAHPSVGQSVAIS